MRNDINARLRETITAAYVHAPATRERFQAAGLVPEDIKSVGDLEKVPVLPKDDVITLQQANPPFGGLLAVPLNQVQHIFLSPGPIYEPEAGDWGAPMSIARLALQGIGFGPGDVVLNTLSYHLVPAGLLLDRSLVEMGCTVMPGGTGNSDLQVKVMADLGVTGYVGTPSFLALLIQKAEEAGYDFKGDFKLAKALVTAEPLPASLRQSLTETYGLTVGNAYATAELGVLALNLEGGLAMQLLPEPILQVVDPDTGRSVGPGEVGEVVVTNFGHAYPLIRLGTGDLAMNLDPRPGESAQEERAVILVGRRGEAVKVRGMFVHPNQLRFAANQVTPVQAIQGVVTRPRNRDHFTVRVVLAEEQADPTALVEPLKESIRQACRVRVDDVSFLAAEAIPPSAPGMVDERDWD